MRPAWLLAFVPALLAGCVHSDIRDGSVVDPPPEPVVRFLVLGDAGTGEAGQYQVARGMERVCARRGCDFVVGLGDNVYDRGVTSPYDPQFETKFERPYRNLTVPFFMTLGNHDSYEFFHGDEEGFGSNLSRGEQQVSYHFRDKRTSDKWQMPARHYEFTWRHARFFALDTNALMGSGQDVDRAALQGSWLERGLARSQKTWTFTFGHHPYASNGLHGDAGTMDGVTGVGLPLKETFERLVCGRVDLHFAGHDHDLQWLAPTPTCPGTEFVVSGAGARPRPLADPNRHLAYFHQGDTLGFAWVELRGPTFTGAFHDAQANLLYERSFTRPA